MAKKSLFFILEIFIFLFVGGLTILEIINFGLFQQIFEYLKNYSSWFIGLSFAYIFSKLSQNKITKIFSKVLKKKIGNKGEMSSEEDLFVAFLISLVIIALITPLIKNSFVYIFTQFFIYFHIIFMQSIIIIYLIFKITNKYQISEKYFLTNEIIVLINTLVILYFVA